MAYYLYVLKYVENIPIIQLASIHSFSLLGMDTYWRFQFRKEGTKMLKLKNLSLFTLVGAVLVLVCQAVSSLIRSDVGWTNWRLVDVLDAGHLAWVDGVSILNVNSVITYMLNMPVFALLFCITAVLFAGDIIRSN